MNSFSHVRTTLGLTFGSVLILKIFHVYPLQNASLTSKDTESWTVLSRNTPPSERVYMWGSGNSHMHVKYWHCWRKRKKMHWAKERKRWRKGNWNRKSSWPPAIVTLQDVNFDLNILWTSISKRFSIQRRCQTRPLKHVFLEAHETPLICLIYILHSLSNKNITVTEMNGLRCHTSGQTPIKKRVF